MTQDTSHSETAEPLEPRDSKGEFAFQIFCASIFLGMIGLVFYNAFLRYVFRSSFAPSEEWARFLFMFITFYGAIEAFYRKKHIAVDMFVGLFGGMKRKVIDIVAQILGIAALFLLLWGGVELVAQMIDTVSVATGVNMGVISAALPIMAFVAIIIRGKELVEMLKKPASEFHKASYDPQQMTFEE
ncbi:MAG: TRAP transporter small permease [Deltaproteobacteria bacterium]|nr:TRAP transporter small permease [Deltaproteobacteria bacterium]